MVRRGPPRGAKRDSVAPDAVFSVEMRVARDTAPHARDTVSRATGGVVVG